MDYELTIIKIMNRLKKFNTTNHNRNIDERLQ